MSLILKPVRFEQKTLDKLNKLATLEDRDTSYLIRKAVEDMLEAHEWQLTEAMKALEAVNNGSMKTHSHDDITQWLKDEGMI